MAGENIDVKWRSQVDGVTLIKGNDLPVSGLISWGECEGIEPSQELEAAPAAVLKLATIVTQAYTRVRHESPEVGHHRPPGLGGIPWTITGLCGLQDELGSIEVAG